MKECISIVMGIFLLGTISIAAQTPPQTSPQSDDMAAALIASSCTRCHGMDKICKKLGKKDRKNWDKTVTRMIKKGADLPVENKGLVVDYLLSLKSGSKPICP